MDHEQLVKLYTLFIRCIELERTARHNLLDQECAGDNELRQAIELLLATDAEDPFTAE